MVYDVSTNDDVDDEPICRPKRRDFKGKQFHTPYDDKRAIFESKRGSGIGKGGWSLNSFKAALKDYTVETGFKIVRDKNEKSRVTAHCAAEGCPWRINASLLLDG
ncbi:hypothetical protein ACSBR1_034561 [Camellia fascicularis]